MGDYQRENRQRYSVQIDSLGLLPWQHPPCRASLADLDQPYDDPSGRRESAEVLKRLFDAGLSRYEPSPLQALQRVEAERQAAK